jgi:hypothetical protein
MQKDVKRRGLTPSQYFSSAPSVEQCAGLAVSVNIAKENLAIQTCLRSSFFRAISAALSSLVMLDDGDIFVLASSQLSSLGGGGDERGVELRLGSVS